MKSSHQRLGNEMLKFHKLLNVKAKRPQRKKKFNQNENDSKLVASGPTRREKSGNKTAKSRRNGESSSLSSSHLSKGKLDSLQSAEEDVDSIAHNDRDVFCSLSEQDYSHLSDRAEPLGSIKGSKGNVREEYCCLNREDHLISDTDEFGECPNPMNIVTGTSCSLSTESSIKEETSMEFLNVLKSSVNEDFDVSSDASPSLTSEKDETELIQPCKNFLPSSLSHFPRPVIPIGPRFQAEIPNWDGTTNIRRHICDDLKWLGTQIWPPPEISDTNTKGIGKGMSDSFASNTSRSVGYVQRHVREARKLLQLEIGSAFSSWKFDEMGEDVSKSWTLKEQKKFESLARLNLPSKDKDFWKLARERFPAKSMKSMVNYYFNVYIPRRMSMETRSCFGEIDSDNDQNKDYLNEDGRSITRIGIVPICKLLKSRIRK